MRRPLTYWKCSPQWCSLHFCSSEMHMINGNVEPRRLNWFIHMLSSISCSSHLTHKQAKPTTAKSWNEPNTRHAGSLAAATATQHLGPRGGCRSPVRRPPPFHHAGPSAPTAAVPPCWLPRGGSHRSPVPVVDRVS